VSGYDAAALTARRQAFEAASRPTCPCCGYPTIPEREACEICPLCAWEDDGQDDPGRGGGAAPDVVVGGVNADYSLTESRANFARNLTAFRPSDIDFERERAATPIKREVVAAYERAVAGAATLEDAENEARTAFARILGF
jgi:hypothetical protein